MKKRIGLIVLASIFALGELAFAASPLSYGGAFRLRQEYWQDVMDLNKDYITGSAKDENFLRLKTTLWGKYAFSENANVYLRLANEARNYMLSNTASYADDPFEKDEGVIDNLYVELKNLACGKLGLKIGRQDFLGVFGEGFLVMDGTPGDGSRTYYFNAAKASYRFNEANSLDLVYIMDHQKDKMLLWDNGKAARTINTSDETGLIAYFRMKLDENSSLEPYYMRKTEAAVGAFQELTLNTLGARYVNSFAPWKFRAELALQSGEYAGTPAIKRSGNGGYAFITRNFKEAKYSPELEAGLVYLSGDDSTTADVEAFNPLFSRWPWLSELYILTYARESGMAYWTNLMWVRLPQVKLQFTQKTSLTASYNILQAAQKTGLSSAMFSNDSTDRGQLLMATVKHVINKDLSGYFMVERFTPGGFYAGSVAPGPATFVRWNIDFKF